MTHHPANVKWTRLSKLTLLMYVVVKKKFVQCQFSGHQDVWVAHFTCVYVPSNTKQASETTANQMAITSDDYCAVSRSLWHQLLLPGAWLILRCKAPLISLDEKGLDWEGMEQGAELCQKSPSRPISLILSLTNHTLPSCQSLLPAQSLDW